MKTYNFRYNRLMPGGIVNFIFLGLFWIGSIPVSMYILFFLGIGGIFGSKGTVFWDNNSKLAITLIFLLPVILIVIFTIIASILYRHFLDAKDGVITIFNNYAKLYYKGKEITLEKGEFSILYDRVKFGRNGAADFLHPITYLYTIKIKNKKHRICTSTQEGHDLTTFWQRVKRVCPELSLSTAMNALIKLANTENNEIKNEIFYIGSVQIITNVSTLEVFENTDYFVDIENSLAIKDVPFIVCDIYESKGSNHLIAEVGLMDNEKNDKLPTMEELKRRVIVSGLELDEYTNNV